MKKYLAIVLSTLAISVAVIMSATAVAEVQNDTEDNTAVVTADVLNVRNGCGMSFDVIGTLNRGSIVQVLGESQGWFMVYVPETGMVGTVERTYVDTGVNTSGDDQETEFKPGEEELKLLSLVNEVRNQAGLPDLILDESLCHIAQLKARDMADNNYFGHTSETYGNPFEMMTAYGIHFGAAGENIAGNSSVDQAFESWTSSEEHIRNIISDSYNKLGIGIVADEAYGQIIVLEFTD